MSTMIVLARFRSSGVDTALLFLMSSALSSSVQRHFTSPCMAFLYFIWIRVIENLQPFGTMSSLSPFCLPTTSCCQSGNVRQCCDMRILEILFLRPCLCWAPPSPRLGIPEFCIMKIPAFTGAGGAGGTVPETGLLLLQFAAVAAADHLVQHDRDCCRPGRCCLPLQLPWRP
jgi:hypothetical protein